MSPAATEIETLRAALADRDGRLAAADAELKSRDLLIRKLKHQLAGMRRHRFGATSEALDRLQLQLEDNEIAAAATTPAQPRNRPKRSRSASRCRTIFHEPRPWCRPARPAAPAAVRCGGWAMTSPRSWRTSPAASS